MVELSKEEKEDIVRKFIEALGDNPDRIGLKDTPERVVRSWKEIYKGYDENLKPKITTFPNGADGIVYNQMLSTYGTFFSMCEHHMVTFHGKFYFGVIYSQKGKIFGLSKIARVVEYFASKLQVQERLTKEVIDYLWDLLNGSDEPPIGMGLVIEAEHLCKCSRGVKNFGSTRTTELRGKFMTHPEVRQEFLEWVNTMVLNEK